ncbi:transglycosylase SLT domain-containing protein, partial [Basilea psittacipulmonis]
MPKIPTYDNYQVTPNTVSTPELRASRFVSTDTQASDQARAVGKDLMEMSLKWRNVADQVRVDEVTTALKEYELTRTYDKDVGFNNIRGADALYRQSEKSLSQEYSDDYQAEVERLANTLGNERQKALFLDYAQKQRVAFEGRIMAHESSEFNTYSQSIVEGKQATAMRELALSYYDPQARAQALETIERQVVWQAQLQGKSAEWVNAQNRELMTKAHKVVLSSALNEGDLAFASNYLNRYADQMSATDLLDMREKIEQGIDIEASNYAVGQAFDTFKTRINPNGFEQVWSALIMQESAGKQFDDQGNPLRSKAGAVGIAQVMEATGEATAKKYGIKWDKERFENDAEYNAHLGQLFLKEQLTTFKGDVVMALAAYNAGPGSEKSGKGVRGAIARATQAGEPENWLSYTPKETQNYVASILKNVNKQKKRTYELGEMPSLEEFKAVAHDLAGSTRYPKRQAIVDNLVQKQYRVYQQERKDEEEKRMKAVYQSVEEYGSFAN